MQLLQILILGRTSSLQGHYPAFSIHKAHVIRLSEKYKSINEEQSTWPLQDCGAKAMLRLYSLGNTSSTALRWPRPPKITSSGGEVETCTGVRTKDISDLAGLVYLSFCSVALSSFCPVWPQAVLSHPWSRKACLLHQTAAKECTFTSKMQSSNADFTKLQTHCHLHPPRKHKRRTD